MQRRLLLLASVLLAACADQPSPADQALTYFAKWTQQADAGQRGDELCHGLGILKHADFSCADMLAAAATVDAASRTVLSSRPLECFAEVCGTFIELSTSGFDQAGNELEETAVLKQDNGQFRVYWYRSSAMLAAFRAANPEPDPDAKDPEQVAYDALVALYPGLYEFPPCYGVRPSSTNLQGKLRAREGLDVDAVTRLAANCPASFCFAFVGRKIAPLCP